MNRVGDYTHFTVRFVGLGYVALWPLSSDGSGRPFGAALFCGEGGSALVDLLCQAPHPLQLSPALHAVGAAAAAFVMVELLLRVVRRRRRRAQSLAVPETIVVARIPGVIPKAPRHRKPSPPPRPVKPRAQFGLRGAPR